MTSQSEVSLKLRLILAGPTFYVGDGVWSRIAISPKKINKHLLLMFPGFPFNVVVTTRTRLLILTLWPRLTTTNNKLCSMLSNWHACFILSSLFYCFTQLYSPIILIQSSVYFSFLKPNFLHLMTYYVWTNRFILQHNGNCLQQSFRSMKIE